MEAVDWENSSVLSSDTEEYLQDTKYEDDEELHFTSGIISKLQFRYRIFHKIDSLWYYNILPPPPLPLDVTLGYGYNFQER